MSLPADYTDLQNETSFTHSRTKIKIRGDSPITNAEVNANFDLLRGKVNSVGQANNDLKDLFGDTADAAASAQAAAQSASDASGSAGTASSAKDDAVSAKNDAEDAADSIKDLTAATGAPGTSANYNSTSGVLTIPRGDKGDKGDTGDQGIQGIPGIKGDTGDQGIQGIQGPQGVKGDKGDKGNQGDVGEQGVQGVPGIQGIQGAQGVQGVQGEKGDVGATFCYDESTKTLTINGVSNCEASAGSWDDLTGFTPSSFKVTRDSDGTTWNNLSLHSFSGFSSSSSWGGAYWFLKMSTNSSTSNAIKNTAGMGTIEMTSSSGVTLSYAVKMDWGANAVQPNNGIYNGGAIGGTQLLNLVIAQNSSY
jgi:hypothetical protein|tara:strand:+ start:756 stop:1847 length:1092 start_codon:yes stop_codon:yes gene_type:complete